MEGNKYYMNSIDLDIILKKMRRNFSENDKQKIIKILNSQSVSHEITNSDFEYENKITILRIYLEHKKKIINGISKIDQENQFTKLFQNKYNLDTESEITNEIEKNEYDFNKEINSEIQKGIEEKLEMDNIVIPSEIIDNENEEENNENEEENNENEEKYKEESLEIFHKLLDIKTNILKMKIQIIDSIRYENTEIYNTICNYENDYQDKKKILQEYRENLDIENEEERLIQDQYYQEKKNEIIDPLINKYVENKKNIEDCIKDTQEFYNEYFDNTKSFNGMVYPEINKKENSENSQYKNNLYTSNQENRYSIENYKYPIYNRRYSSENYKYPIYNSRYSSENYKYPIYNSRYLTEDYRSKSYKQDYDKDNDEDYDEENNPSEIDKQIEDIKDNKSNLKKVFERLRIGAKDYDSNETEYFNKLDSDTQKNINEIEKKN